MPLAATQFEGSSDVHRFWKMEKDFKKPKNEECFGFLKRVVDTER